MNRFISSISFALIMAGAIFAESPKEGYFSFQLQDPITSYRDIKPNKEAKKRAKKLEKQGWMPPVGERQISRQIMNSLLLNEEVLENNDGDATMRYIAGDGIAVAADYSAAYNMALINAQAQIVSLIETQLVVASERKLNNQQESALSATVLNKFQQVCKTISQNSLSNPIEVIKIYRVRDDGNYEVQIRLMFDKGVLAMRLQQEIKSRFEKDAAPLLDSVNEALMQVK